MKGMFTALSVISALCAVIAWPVLTYDEGSSRGVSVKVVEEPFAHGDELVYRWTGDVFRSCDVVIRRSFVDANDVVTALTPITFSALPQSLLGQTSYEITVVVPKQIAEGTATYSAVEVPECTWLQRLWPVSIPYPPVVFTVTRKDNDL
jgi:hypothetical protein